MLRLLLLASALSSTPEAARDWQKLVGVLQYLEADYPAAVSTGDRLELEEQASLAAEALDAVRALGEPGRALVPKVESIQARILRSEDVSGVSRDCAALVEEAVALGGLQRSPRQAPDLEHGRQLYAQACAACHGLTGDAKVPVAETMEPRPRSFVDPEVMDGLSPYKAFNTASLGVTGTAMPDFSVLPESDRWALAFYLFTLRQPPCEGQPPRVELEELARSTDAELAQRYGAAALSCLRRKPPALDEDRAWAVASGGVDSAMKKAAAGDSRGARDALLDAYLNGVEPVEPRLRARDPALVRSIEAAFLQARLAAEQGSPAVQEEGRRLLELIDRARGKTSGSPQDFWSVFWLAALILLREGFEATVVIAALLAVLKKLQQPQHARLVHAGWLSALAAGGVTFAFARQLISGQNREMVEGVMALLAVGMLLYAALWLNARSNIRKFMGELRTAMQGAIGRGSVAGLFAISFTAMFRESFETAIFLQGLSIDSTTGTLWGAAAGGVALVGLVLFVSRVGYRLPMKPLFNASTVLLVLTAVVLLGKGLHAIQEVGLLPLMPIRMVEVEVLGVYPDGLSFFPQLLLALGPLVWVLVRHRTDGKPGQGEGVTSPGAKHA